jgi:DNA-binding NtrC family response regulator
MGEYAWPGNVRELRNVIQRAYILIDAPNGEITPQELPAILGGASSPADPLRVEVGMPLDEAKKRLVLGTVQRCSTKKEAAEVLGVSLKTLYNHLNRYRRESSSSGEDEDT